MVRIWQNIQEKHTEKEKPERKAENWQKCSTWDEFSLHDGVDCPEGTGRGLAPCNLPLKVYLLEA